MNNLYAISETNDEDQRVTSYTRWGRKVCEGNATLVYKDTMYCVLSSTML